MLRASVENMLLTSIDTRLEIAWKKIGADAAPSGGAVAFSG